MKIAVGDKGTIKLPESIMRSFGIAKGDSFIASEEDGELVLRFRKKKDPLLSLSLSEIESWLRNENIDEEIRSRILQGWKEERKLGKK